MEYSCYPAIEESTVLFLKTTNQHWLHKKQVPVEKVLEVGHHRYGLRAIELDCPIRGADLTSPCICNGIEEELMEEGIPIVVLLAQILHGLCILLELIPGCRSFCDTGFLQEVIVDKEALCAPVVRKSIECILVGKVRQHGRVVVRKGILRQQVVQVLEKTKLCIPGHIEIVTYQQGRHVLCICRRRYLLAKNAVPTLVDDIYLHIILGTVVLNNLFVEQLCF